MLALFWYIWLLDYFTSWEIRRLISFCPCYWDTLRLGRLCMHLRVSGVNRMATRTLRGKVNNNKAESFFRLNLSVYIDLDNRERAKARDNKQRRSFSVQSLEEKHKNFIPGVRKWEMLAASKAKMSDNVKKANRNAYGISNTKPVSGKFLEPVSCCSRAKQCNGKEMYKKVCCTCKIDILQIRPIAVFFFAVLVVFAA